MNKIIYKIYVHENDVEIVIRIQNEKHRVIELYKERIQDESDNFIADEVVLSDGKEINHYKMSTEYNIDIVIPSYNKRNIEIKYSLPKESYIGQRGKCISRFSKDYFYLFSETHLFFLKDIVMPCVLIIHGEKYEKVFQFASSEEIKGICLAGGKNAEEERKENVWVSMINKPSLNMKSLDVIELFNTIERMMGMVPYGKQIRINIIRDSIIHGGFSGNYSLISEDKKEVLFHELLHIWIGNEINFSDDSDPYKEGLTEYISLKLLYSLGYLPAEEIKKTFGDKYNCYLKSGGSISETFLADKKMSYDMDCCTSIYDGMPCYFLLIEIELNTLGFSIYSLIERLKEIKEVQRDRIVTILRELTEEEENIYNRINEKTHLKPEDIIKSASVIFS